MRFRLEIEAYPNIKSDNIYISFDLRLNHKKLHEFNSTGDLIQTVKLKINDIENGNFNYCSAEFDSPYSPKLNFFIFTHLTNFKFDKFKISQKELQSFDK
jgi:hypothetical protein